MFFLGMTKLGIVALKLSSVLLLFNKKHFIFNKCAGEARTKISSYLK